VTRPHCEFPIPDIDFFCPAEFVTKCERYLCTWMSRHVGCEDNPTDPGGWLCICGEPLTAAHVRRLEIPDESDSDWIDDVV
jgi:hypothetical protein